MYVQIFFCVLVSLSGGVTPRAWSRRVCRSAFICWISTFSFSLDDLPALLQTIQAGGGMGQSVPKAADPNDKEDTEE